MRGWYPLEVLHFPIRTPRQLERKGALWGSAVEKFYASEEVVAGPGAAYHALAFRDSETRPERERLRRARRARRCELARSRSRPGLLVEDTRLRDALRAARRRSRPLAFHRPTAAEDAAFAVDAAVLGEADLVRVRRRLDELGRRVTELRVTTWPPVSSAGCGRFAQRVAAEALMRIAMTLVVRDEADIVETWLRYHLAAGSTS